MNDIEMSKANLAKVGTVRFWAVWGLAVVSVAVWAGLTLLGHVTSVCR